MSYRDEVYALETQLELSRAECARLRARLERLEGTLTGAYIRSLEEEIAALRAPSPRIPRQLALMFLGCAIALCLTFLIFNLAGV